MCIIHASHQHIIIYWVPGYRGIEGNRLADQNATSITSINSSIAVAAINLKHFMRKKMRGYWQCVWENLNKLHIIKPQLVFWPSTTKTRQTNVLFCRFRIGHTYGTRHFSLTCVDPPMCSSCGERLTVFHVLIECQEADPQRKQYFPLAYRHHISLQSATFLGKDPFFFFCY